MGRAIKKIIRKRKKNTNKKLSEKLGMFDKLGTLCEDCGKRFDKHNKSMVRTWKVAVGGGEVDLYCPTCWREKINE